MTQAEFKTELLQKAFVVKLPQQLGESEAKALDLEMKAWLLKPVDLFVFDFSQVESIDTSVFRAFALFRKTLKSHEKNVVAINMAKKIKLNLMNQGMLDVFNPVDHLKTS